jgi:hypothetical protein
MWQIKHRILVVVGVVLIVLPWIIGLPSMAHTSSPNTFYTFATNERLTAEKLNTNFSHLHSTLTGGIKDENISTSAAIQITKLDKYGYIPRVFGQVGATSSPCNGAVAGTSCALYNVRGITSVVGVGTAGRYDVTMTTFAGVNYPLVFVSSGDGTVFCSASPPTSAATVIPVSCWSHAGVATNAVFSIMIMWP